LAIRFSCSELEHHGYAAFDKSTIIIWTTYDPAELELTELAHEAESGTPPAQWLRAARAEFEKEQAQKRWDALSAEQTTLTEDDEEYSSDLSCLE
jgi:hypothetical protein